MTQQQSSLEDLIRQLLTKVDSLEGKVQQQQKLLEKNTTYNSVTTENITKKSEIYMPMPTEKTELDSKNLAFIEAVDLVKNTNESLFLTGKAGTGKTTFLKYLKENLDKNYVVLAPTGVAAVNAGGETIHSFFRLSFSPYLPNDHRLQIEELKFHKQKLDMLKSLQTIIIDEISMVRCDIIDAISQILKNVRKNPKAFGGVQMIFIGDLFQLSPIAQTDFWEIVGEYYNSEFFFEAQALNPKYNKAALNYKIIELEKIYRQNDPIFINLLNKFRNNKLTNEDFYTINSRYKNNTEDAREGYITLSTHRNNVDSVNNTQLKKLSTELYSFNAIIDGEFNEKDAPADPILSIKVGAQVMLLKNNIPEYYNGSIGYIESIEKEEFPIDNNTIVDDVISIRLASSNNIIKVTRMKWENNRYVKNKETNRIEPEVIGSFTQFPIKLAWAITIHKSQGLTFDKVIIDAGRAFTHGQTYVALSRCRSLDGIILKTKIESKSVIVNNEVKNFMNKFYNESPKYL